MKIRRDFDSHVTSQYGKVTGSIVLCGRTATTEKLYRKKMLMKITVFTTVSVWGLNGVVYIEGIIPNRLSNII